ncbi:MAG: metallophosphoesterase [Puniceicoccales bacterium]|nr:metallophosphoesterase [Puniceicoccales bacterium]
MNIKFRRILTIILVAVVTWNMVGAAWHSKQGRSQNSQKKNERSSRDSRKKRNQSAKKENAKHIRTIDRRSSRDLQKKRSTSQTFEDVAVVCATDLHCNDQNYPGIENIVNRLCLKHDTVIVVINGDINTKRNPITHRIIPSSEKYADTRVNRLKLLVTSFSILLRNPNLYIVFNVGNHEVMNKYPHLMSCFFQKMTELGGNRFHVISNFKTRIPFKMVAHEPQDGFKRFVKPYVYLNRFGFIGYCTKDIFPWGRPQDQKCYRYALENFFVNEGKSKYVNRFIKNCKKTLARPEIKVIFAVAHAGAKEFNRLGLARSFEGVSKPIVIILGHNHRQDHAEGALGQRTVSVQPYPYGKDVAIIKFKNFVLTSLEYVNTSFKH